MKYSATFGAVASLAACVSGFPALSERQSDTPFDAAEQYVSNQGDHAFIAPGPNDVRGPCPGLNAAANHGYIPRNGVGTVGQMTSGCDKAFGMGYDLGGFLSILGTTIDGDGHLFSIGGKHSSVGFGGPTGLSGSHNKYECDASPVRGDLYQYGNNTDVIASQWQELYDLQKDVPNEQANYNLGLMTKFRSNRFDQSVHNNPYFFNGAFSGVLVQPAAYTFIYRFMSNKSAEHPDGILDKETLKAFFGMTENADGSFSGGKGFERIPDNWYRRSSRKPYGIIALGGDLLSAARQYPKFLSVGGNTGKVDTFTGLDLPTFSGGLYNLGSLLEGNNLLCFAYQFAQQGSPDLITSLLSTLLGPQVANTLLSLGCPALAKFNEEQLNQFPGYAMSQ